MKTIAIIGNGISGITAARHIRKIGDDRIVVISGETDHFYSRTALMYIYMGHMTYEHTKPYEDWFWDKNSIELVRGWVEQLLPEQKQLKLSNGEVISYDQLIIASGSKSKQIRMARTGPSRRSGFIPLPGPRINGRKYQGYFYCGNCGRRSHWGLKWRKCYLPGT